MIILDYKLLGKRIREERLKLNLTQEKLAEKSNISHPFMGQIERGDRIVSLETLVKLSNSLGVSIDYLLKDSVMPCDDTYIKQFADLITDCSIRQKESIIELVKMFVSFKE